VLLLTTMTCCIPAPAALVRNLLASFDLLWGVIKLLEYSSTAGGTRPSGIGAGGVLLLSSDRFGLSATQAFAL